MDQREINKMRQCSHLLPPPGGEVVRGLLDEIEKLQGEDTGQFCHIADIGPNKAFVIPELGQVYIRLNPPQEGKIPCMRVSPDVTMELMPGSLRVCPVRFDVSWSYIK